MRPTTSTIFERAWWGPVLLEVSRERTAAQARDGARIEVWSPPWHEGGRWTEVVAMLREGLPVLVDGEPRIMLRQPERKVWHRRDRKILIEGDPELVPSGLFFRARWQQGVGLEVSTELGAPRDQRLIRPPIDLGIGFPWWRRSADRSLSLELIALWIVTTNRLRAAMHIL